VVIAAVAFLVLFNRGDDDDGSDEVFEAATTTTETTTTTSSTTTSSTTTTTSTSTPPDDDDGDGGLASGLFCRDLNAMGYSYADAVGYWNVWGQPDRMDEDLNGYPCETVYPAADVIAYWGFDPP